DATVTGAPTPPTPPPSTGKHYLVVGTDAGNSPVVTVFDASGKQKLISFLAYDATFGGGVRVAVGDGDGGHIDDGITVPGPGGGSNVKVFRGTDFSLMQSFTAYPSDYTGGLYVAAGDLDHDGHADIVTGVTEGHGSQIKVFRGSNAGQVIRSFLA